MPPGEANWGGVCRVYRPGSPQFKYLYGGRNDTEARHADLKARVKYLPRDILGQELRLLGPGIAINAIAWQVHLQAHGEKMGLTCVSVVTPASGLSPMDSEGSHSQPMSL